MEEDVVEYDFQSVFLEERKNKIEKGGLLKMFDESTFMENKPIWERDLFKKINIFCLNEIKAGVAVTYLSTYTRYSYRNRMFVKVKGTQEALKIYLKLHYSELESPPNWLRDYEKVSRQTWVEGTIRERDLINETILLDSIFDLIRKSFNRVIKHPKISEVLVEKPVKTLPNFVHPTKMKFSVEIGTDGFCNLGISVHKSQLIKVLEKLL